MFVLHAFSTADNKPDFHSVFAKDGDGVFTILRRYQLLHPCNLDKFYELNQLKEGDYLQEHKEYKLPVLIYKYNGKSIRSTLDIESWDKAIEIKKYNEDILSKGLRQTHYSVSNILWVPYHLTGCLIEKGEEEPRTENITNPEITTTSSEDNAALVFRNFEIFGKEYAKTPILSAELGGQVFYVVSGHGGPDPGAMAESNNHALCEDEYAYDVALRLCRNLIQRGATAYMIVRDEDDGIRDEAYLECDQDEKCYSNREIPLNQLTRLKQRAHVINQLYQKYQQQGIKKQYCLVLHVDSRHQDTRTDLYFYHHRNSRKSKRLSESIYEIFKNKYAIHRSNGQYNGSISSRNLYMIRETMPPTVYIEMGNLRNQQDQKRFLINSNRQAVADWITEGVIQN
jgi:N-acetylmuramoyl-L-alanine amidase